jgi:hypothetical protein
MKITKVNKIERNNTKMFEVHIDDDGEESIECFVGSNWSEDNFKAIEDRIILNRNNLKKANKQDVIIPKITELNQFKNKEIIIKK